MIEQQENPFTTHYSPLTIFTIFTFRNSMPEKEKYKHSRVITISMMSMLVSLLISRGALSVTMIGFLIITILHRNVGAQLRNFSKNYFLIGVSLLFFIPFVSGLWSSNLNAWSGVTRTKLPLILFPLAFAGSWTLQQKQWRLVALCFLTIVLAGCIWSLFHYLKHMEAFDKAYLKAKLITTPLEDDHVRFSWLTSVAAICCILVWHYIRARVTKVMLILLFLFFTIYLHILAARTGLFSLYIFLFLYSMYSLFKRKAVFLSFSILVLLIAAPLTAWLVLPTLRNRVSYFLYDISYAQKQQYLPGSNDGARLLSVQAGWSIVQQYPLGAGAGDITKEEMKWYHAHVPGMLSTDQFYPCSEWLMYGCFAGWPGILLFTSVMLLPFFIRMPKKHAVFWIALNATAAFSFILDIGLEAQYGVFLYAFLLLWWYKWFQEAYKFNYGE